MTRSQTGYNTALDGVRAVASFGVMATHVAFQTGVDPASTIGSILARFDFFVAVFFALSGFVLWRGIDRYRGRWGAYYRNRAARILPAYLVLVLTVVLVLPDASGMSTAQIVANLTLTQIYWQDGLAPGLTHLWSLCVEVAFYLVLPLLASAVTRAGWQLRIVVFSLLGVVSLGWAYLPFVAATPADGVVNRQIWPPAYTLWFAVGLIAAECEGRIPARARGVLQWRWLWWALALLTAWVAGQEWFGPLGLEHPTPAAFTRRVIAGAVFAALIVVPYALAPGPGLMTGRLMQFLGRISYSVFLWHLPVLALVFPMTGISYFSGGFLLVYLLTAGMTTVVAAASYEFIEDPARRFFRRAGGSGTKHANAAAHSAARDGSSPA